MSKVILTDIDGVVLNWIDPFSDWIENEKMPLETFENSLHDFKSIEEWLGISTYDTEILIKEFSETEYFKTLPSFHDAEVIIPALKKLDYKFIAITACDNSEQSKIKREINLETIFPGVFDDIIFSEDTAPNNKKSDLEKWNKCYWVEDTHSHAVTGHELGHTSFLFYNPIRYPEIHPELIPITGWYDIFKYITGFDYE